MCIKEMESWCVCRVVLAQDRNQDPFENGYEISISRVKFTERKRDCLYRGQTGL